MMQPAMKTKFNTHTQTQTNHKLKHERKKHSDDFLWYEYSTRTRFFLLPNTQTTVGNKRYTLL